MKHTTPYPHQGQQILVSILLATGFIVSYNPSTTLAIPSNPRAMASNSCKPTSSKAGTASPRSLDKSLSTLEPDTTILWPLQLDEDAQKTLADKITARPGGANSSTEDAEIQKNLREIREGDILPEPTCDKIAALVAKARHFPSSFDAYVKISATRENFERRMHEAIVNCAAAQAGEQAQEIDRRHIKRRRQLLAELATLVRSAIDQNRLAFIKNALDCSEELKELFFSNRLLTEENISRRYGELTQEFHPDKAKWIPEAYQSTARDLMALITACRDGLMQNLQTAAAASGKYTFYQKQGDSFWAMAKDCRHAQKGEWDQLTGLLQADFDYLSEAALEKSKIENATRAYEAYRACCRLADEQKPTSLLNQIQLRGSMALYLYAAGRYLEAQLHALGAMRLIFAQTKRVNLQVLQDTQVILAKVQGQGNILPAGSTAQIIGNIMSSEPIQALITFGGSLEATTIESRCSWNDIARIRGAIQGDLSKIARKLILNSDPNLVKYQASEEDILRTSTQAVRYKVAGGATMAGGVLAGGLVFAGGVLNILQGAGVVAGATFGGPALAIVSGTIFIGLGIWGGVSLWQKGAILMKKPAICEKLNGMMQQALAYYNQGELQKFIAALAKEYATGKQLLSLGSFRYGVPAEEIITSLTEHGFRPDGIAYLFNLMGEAFNSGKVRIPGCLQSDLPSRAMYSFNGSLREELVESAAKLDERISEMRKKDRISIMQKCINTLRGFFMLRDEGYLAREHVEDAQEMPFKVILEEMRNVAKLNIAMIRILREWQVVGGEQAEINAAKKLLQEVRNTIDHYGQFHTMPALRLAAIEDFLWVVSGHTAAIKAPA